MERFNVLKLINKLGYIVAYHPIYGEQIFRKSAKRGKICSHAFNKEGQCIGIYRLDKYGFDELNKIYIRPTKEREQWKGCVWDHIFCYCKTN